MTITVGSLFSGIGGLDLGLERAGMTVRWQSENDPYACRVLAKHWPTVPNLGDVRTIDWSTVERVDLICGGYPCQPFSLAGARGGAGDPRHLWPYFAEALRQLRPSWALLENVPGHLSMGFGDVLGDLAELGFDADWDCIPAATVGAPHLRYRVFVVAHAGGARRRQDTGSAPQDEGQDAGRPAYTDHIADGDGQGDRARNVADADCRRQPGDEETWGRRREVHGDQQRLVHPRRRGPDVADADEVGRGRRAGIFGQGWRTEPANGGWWAVEPDVGRVAYGVPNRVDRLRCLGNAVVLQVAEWVGRQIMRSVA